MKIGILSDNHGRVEPVERSAAIFSDQEVEAVMHCGDLGSLDALEPLVGKPIWFVWGNTDLPQPTWRPQADGMGAHWPESEPVELELAGRSLAIFHGHERSFRAACAAPQTDYILHGHTHVPAARRVQRARIINPGALHRTATKTVAVLDLNTDDLQYFTVS